MLIARRVGLVLIAVAALIVWFVLAPSDAVEDPDSALGYDSLIDLALANYDLNNDNTESAPQQQVVNGWVAKDLLQIVAIELDDIQRRMDAQADDQRTPALIGLAVLAIAWFGITTPGRRREASATVEVPSVDGARPTIIDTAPPAP